MIPIKQFQTKQCDVIIYNTLQIFLDKEVYCIVSIHHNNGKKNVRFGTAEQIKQICNTYKIDKKFNLGSKNDTN